MCQYEEVELRSMGSVDGLIGRGGDNPLSREELWDKFSDCASRALPTANILPLFERLESLDKVDDIGQPTQLMRRRDQPGTARSVSVPGVTLPSARGDTW